ncbi:cysteine-rich receptor-like protein kinase 15 isoform X1 [Ananas comosus]|uniref:Cysteine-rich receptor-like protein kinase 15 isoform X1 n=1 Tax=Ananas comosus TaxID=4615 RepID=A0A6P5EU70_ANACO|nr:cysteine-rich receptor-like protein kinase 15 isoform X1 [Ananas comosus]
MSFLQRVPILLLSSSIILLSTKIKAQFLYNLCQNSGSYTTNSTFVRNLNLLLTSLTANTPNSGFFNNTIGTTPDQVYGLALCRGDIGPQECTQCLQTASQDLPQLCPYKRSAIAWYSECHVRYAATKFFSKLDESLTVLRYYNQNVSDPREFNYQSVEMIGVISSMAAFNTSTQMFATGVVNITDIGEVYGLAQCTRDLSRDQCFKCLNDSLSDLQKRCYDSPGGIALQASCVLRYDLNKFLESTPLWTAPSTISTAPPSKEPFFPPPLPGATHKRHKEKLVTATIVICVCVLLLSLVACSSYISLSRRKKIKKRKLREDIQEDPRRNNTLEFDLFALKEATDNFSNVNKLGEGGFGAVYKGTFLDGQEVAVKTLSRSSEEGVYQLKNELQFLTKVQHRNLVKLLGFCIAKEEMLLVYEYVQNKSLDTFIFGDSINERINWEQRYKIIQGVARGLLYLHEDSTVRIIHRDLKASNILLDEKMNPKISDFGVARLLARDHTESKTTRVVGTFGYMAPEYAIEGNVSTKADVFSFGVLVLEIVSGRSNISFYDPTNVENLLSYAWQCWKSSTATKLIDPSISENCPIHEVLRCIHIGLLCVQENPVNRPQMSSVFLMLTRNKMKLRPPSQPAFCFKEISEETSILSREPNSLGGTIGQSISRKDTQISVNEVTNTEIYPR